MDTSNTSPTTSTTDQAGAQIGERNSVVPERYAHIKGWGADLDKATRPAVPMERMPPRLDGVHWDRPPHQVPTVEVLHSNERPGLTLIFGTTLPPTGMSGSLRRVAFRFSENDLRHWIVLLLADRINMVEGLASDVSQGRVPNVFAEMGGRAELTYNPGGAARKAAALAAIVGLYVLLRRRRRRLR